VLREGPALRLQGMAGLLARPHDRLVPASPENPRTSREASAATTGSLGATLGASESSARSGRNEFSQLKGQLKEFVA
jgi:hypothetical protein